MTDSRSGARETPEYTSRIIKASALIPDSRVLFAGWDLDRSVDENFASARRENVFAKASRSRVEDILTVFRWRYFSDPDLGRALVVAANSARLSGELGSLLYVASARADRLLHDLVTEFLFPRRESGFADIAINDIERQIADWVNEGKTIRQWGDPTIRRVAQGLLATLRDFGVLRGIAHKQIVVPPLSAEAFSFIALLLNRDTRSGDRLRNHPDWRLLLLNTGEVERLFVEAHQRRYLEYQAAGRVVRISFPTSSLEDYARALAS